MPVEKCHIRENCKQVNGELCGHDCWKMLQLSFQYSQARIPMEYLEDNPIKPEECDRDAFLFLRDYKENVYRKVKSEKEGVFLFSKNKGNGKTTWAVKIMREYFRQLHRTIESFEDAKGIFINVPILFDTLRNNIDNPGPEAKLLESKIKNADLVIFDDIGTEAPTKWVREKLYIYITHREMEGKPSIYTSNLSLGELESEDLLGERIVDRIYKQVGENIVHFRGSSKRRRVK